MYHHVFSGNPPHCFVFFCEFFTTHSEPAETARSPQKMEMEESMKKKKEEELIKHSRIE
jgi:hypothetical protein